MAIVEIEAIVNSRPLSYVHPDDLEQPLTPSHLIVGRRLLSLPDHLTHLEPLEDEDFELNRESLQRRTKHLNNVINHFWKSWSREYLLQLQDTHRQQNLSKTKVVLEVGDIVLVHNQDNPRGFWKLARVQSLITGRDGIVRGATLRVGSKSGSPTILQRPLQLIYPLEIHNDPSTITTTELQLTTRTLDESLDSITPELEPVRPQRKAAVEARQCVQQWCAEDLIDHG